MSARRTVIVIAIVATVAIGAYFAGRFQGQTAADAGPHSPTPIALDASRDVRAVVASDGTGRALPPPWTSLKRSHAELQARTDAGDVTAATRLYRDLSLCRLFAAIDQGNARLAEELLGQDTRGLDAQQLQQYRAQLDGVEARKRNMDRFRTLCGGVGEDVLNRTVPTLRRAAQLGEPYARACYLASGPNFDPDAFIAHPDMLAEYRNSVPRLIEAGIEAGDWRVVDQLRSVYAPGARSLLSAVLGRDAERHYRYLKLFRLGTVGKAGPLDGELAAASAGLDAAQRARADAWARQTFQRNFRGRPVDADGALWDSCVFPQE